MMSIEEIKSKLSLAAVLHHYDLKPDKNYRLSCPFHEDKTPSMQVYPRTNSVYCFSSNCKTQGKSLDVIDFILYKENTSKREAIAKAKSLVGLAVRAPILPPKPEPPMEKNLSDIFKKLQSSTGKSAEAKSYLQGRSLDLTKLAIGYNTGFYKDLKHCIVFALKDKEDKIVSFYGRSIYNTSNERHYYQTGRSGLYPGYPAGYTKKLILTESIIDAATLLQEEEISRQYSILALYGTNGLTGQHLEAIKELKELEELIFMLDNDESGKAATEKLSKHLNEHLPKLRQSTVTLPGKDINETAQGHDASVFIQLLSEREFIFSTEKEKVDHPEMVTPASRPLNTAFSRLHTNDVEQIHYNTEELCITLLGGISLQNLDRLRVTIYLRRNPHINACQSIRQTIDLYQDEAIEKFIRKAAEKTDHSTSLISSVIAEMTEALEAWRIKQVEAKKASKPQKKELTIQEKEVALKNLQSEGLMEWTMETLIRTGIVGEASNAMILYTAMTSRLYEDPVSVICLSQSGSGKSYLLERVAKCFPAEDIIENTQFTDNSFYYWKEGLKGKIILIEDMEGAQNVEYPMRELITKKYITKTVVHKDSKGNMQTVQHRVEGPATFLGCTTKEKLYEDNANRCVLIYLDGSKEQDKKVMDYQKKVRAGSIDKTEEHAKRELLKNMQSLLQPKKVINPYATLIDLPESVLKPRRSIGIVLSFIESITLYHQYQCTVRDGFLITHPTHIEWALRLLKESLFRKSDELSASLRSFLENVKVLQEKQKKQSFYMQDIRLAMKLHPRTAGRYLYELLQYGYIKITGGNKYRKGYEYELTELSVSNNLQSSIDKHIERVMKKIWIAYEREDHPE